MSRNTFDPVEQTVQRDRKADADKECYTNGLYNLPVFNVFDGIITVVDKSSSRAKCPPTYHSRRHRNGQSILRCYSSTSRNSKIIISDRDRSIQISGDPIRNSWVSRAIPHERYRCRQIYKSAALENVHVNCTHK